MPLVLPNVIENETPADAVEVQQNYGVTQQYINQNLINRDGSVAMQAPLTLFGTPTADLHAATKAYVDTFMPVGVILPYGGAAAPAGGRWALCNGAALATVSYPELFSVLGFDYGGSGGLFNLPQMAGRVPLGLHSEQARFDKTGKTGGSYTAVNTAHTHAINHDHAEFNSGLQTANHTHEHPHTHPINHGHGTLTTSESGAHNHQPSAGDGFYAYVSGGVGAENNAIVNNPATSPKDSLGAGATDTSETHHHTLAIPTTTGVNSGAVSEATTGTMSQSHAHPVNIPSYTGISGSQGTANAEQIPPFVIVNYIIRLD